MFIEYRDVIDKSDWERGPWDDEPDKVQWKDEKTGLDCLIVRAPATGALCGYVGVPAGHPWHGLDYYTSRYDDDGNEVELSPAEASLNDVEVHGGLTFAGHCRHSPDPGKGICHVPDEGEPDDLYWLGFDCAHAFDLAPAIVATLRKVGHDLGWHQDDQYRDLAYVKAEVTALAKQAAEVTA